MKKYTKFSIFFLTICLSFLWGKQSQAYDNYKDEGVVFYTQASSAGYAAEGIAFYEPITQTTGTLPIYRFAKTSNGDHLYTNSENEKNVLLSNPQSGYVFEGISFYAPITQLPGTVPVYRFSSPSTSYHFFTTDENEKNALLSNPQWGYFSEGISYYAYPNQTTDTSPVYRFVNPTHGNHFFTASEIEKNAVSVLPVYRFYNPQTGDHFYTAVENEKNIVANTSKSGYLPEGAAFFTYSNQISGTIPVYRFFNVTNNFHFYTTVENEKNTLINGGQTEYKYEGIAYYAFANQAPGTYPVYRLYNVTTNNHFYTLSENEKYHLLNPPLGPEISVGLWSYSKADIMKSAFQINANRTYDIRNAGGDIVAQVGGNSTTSVSYDDTQNQLTVSGSINQVLAGTTVTFDAADGDNSTIVFNTHRSNYIGNDWRGNIDNYRGKIRVQYYHGPDIVGSNTSSTVTQFWIDNILPLEQYAWGSAETSGTGNINHTEVMSTIYRTYGFWYIKYANKYSAYGFKIRSDSGSQNYGGYDWEINHPNVKAAAQNTRGFIATYANDVALTPYSSWSDGHTRSYQEVWGSTDYPWCQSVPDPYGNDASKSSGSHKVGLIANGSVNLANNYGWDWQRILHYYYTGIDLSVNY